MSDTPRTDAVIKEMLGDWTPSGRAAALIALARQLERELAAEKLYKLDMYDD